MLPLDEIPIRRPESAPAAMGSCKEKRRRFPDGVMPDGVQVMRLLGLAPNESRRDDAYPQTLPCAFILAKSSLAGILDAAS